MRLIIILALPLALLGVMLAAVVVLNTGSKSEFVDQPLLHFVEEVAAGNVEKVTVDGAYLRYELYADDVTYRTRMETGDTIRQILGDIGVPPSDFPEIEIEE